jgi:hypothetical protein
MESELVTLYRTGTRGYVSFDGETIEEIDIAADQGLAALAVRMSLQPFSVFSCPHCRQIKIPRNKIRKKA